MCARRSVPYLSFDGILLYCGVTVGSILLRGRLCASVSATLNGEIAAWALFGWEMCGNPFNSCVISSVLYDWNQNLRCRSQSGAPGNGDFALSMLSTHFRVCMCHFELLLTFFTNRQALSVEAPVIASYQPVWTILKLKGERIVSQHKTLRGNNAREGNPKAWVTRTRV